MKKINCSSAMLQNIAFVTMFIDHFFAIVFSAYMDTLQGSAYLEAYYVYRTGRAIGRISFVLFAYLLVEGFVYTRNRKKYLLRLGVLALLSEIPFDLAFQRKLYAPESQNVYFTLVLGLFVMLLLERYQNKGVQVLVILSGCAAAWVLQTDYMFMGILLIVSFYYNRGRLFRQMVWSALIMGGGMIAVYLVRYGTAEDTIMLYVYSGLRELYGMIAFLFIACYRGERGSRIPKAITYGFYPLHLLVLTGIRQLLLG